MCVKHGKKINDWLRTNEVLELFLALAEDLGIQVKCQNSRNLEALRLSASDYTKMFPGMIISKGGSPETGSGTWLHPDLAIQLAMWCNPKFALQVIRWVRESILEQNRRAQEEDDKRWERKLQEELAVSVAQVDKNIEEMKLSQRGEKR